MRVVGAYNPILVTRVALTPFAVRGAGLASVRTVVWAGTVGGNAHWWRQVPKAGGEQELTLLGRGRGALPAVVGDFDGGCAWWLGSWWWVLLPLGARRGAGGVALFSLVAGLGWCPGSGCGLGVGLGGGCWVSVVGGGLWWLLGLGVFCFVLFFVFWCVFVVVCLFWGWLVGWWWGCLLCGVVRGCGLLFGGWLVCGWVVGFGFGLVGCRVVV